MLFVPLPAPEPARNRPVMVDMLNDNLCFVFVAESGPPRPIRDCLKAEDAADDALVVVDEDDDAIVAVFWLGSVIGMAGIEGVDGPEEAVPTLPVYELYFLRAREGDDEEKSLK